MAFGRNPPPNDRPPLPRRVPVPDPNTPPPLPTKTPPASLAPWPFPPIKGLLTCPEKDCDKPATWPLVLKGPSLPELDDGIVLEFCPKHGRIRAGLANPRDLR